MPEIIRMNDIVPPKHPNKTQISRGRVVPILSKQRHRKDRIPDFDATSMSNSAV